MGEGSLLAIFQRFVPECRKSAILDINREAIYSDIVLVRFRMEK